MEKVKKFKKIKKKNKENPKGELFKLFIRKEGKEFLFRKIEEKAKESKDVKKELLKLVKQM